MSRLTATQIIEKGDYLQPDFNPNTLTVSQLLGILGYHEIRYPTPYSKPKLVQIFNDTIKANSQELSDSRSEAEPSDDGITDGITGELLSAQRTSSSHVERTPRKRSKDTGETPVKRRRSSRRSLPRKVSQRQPLVVEDSDSDIPTPRRPTKTKKAKAPAKKRVSEADDTGWEDNNVFQSGPDLYSPTSSPKKTPRPGSAGVSRSRKSTPGAPSAPAPPAGRVSLPPEPFPPMPREPLPSNDRQEPAREPTPVSSEIHHDYYTRLNDISDGDTGEPKADVASPSPDAEADAEDMKEASVPPSTKRTTGFSMLLLGLLILGCLHMVVIHKTELAEIGYCDNGEDANTFLEELRSRKIEEENCRKGNVTSSWENSTACPLPDILPFIHPNHCVPCPNHGTCTQHSVTCDKGYLLQVYTPFPVYTHGTFEHIGAAGVRDYISRIRSAMGSLWPYVRPRCIPDVGREQKLVALRRSILTFLAQERGRRLCEGDISREPRIPIEEGGEARRWGVEISELKVKMGQLAKPKPPNFDDLFEEAVHEVLLIGKDVLLGETTGGKKYIGHTMPSLPWACTIVVKARQAWEDWKWTIFGLGLLVTVLGILKYRRGHIQREKRCVAELVQEALDVLQTQEKAHHTDSVSHPVPYYSSDQLRDYILQHEHSVTRRQRLWEQVSKIVEANANVRVNEEEVEGVNGGEQGI